MRISERLKLVPVIESKDYGSAGLTCASLNMALLHSVALVFTFGALTGNSTLLLYSGATSAALTTAIAFATRLGSGAYKAANADGLGALTAQTSAGLLLTAATYQHKTLVVEVKGIAMGALQWLTPSLDNVATVLNVGCVGVGDPRYEMNGQVTVL